MRLCGACQWQGSSIKVFGHVLESADVGRSPTTRCSLSDSHHVVVVLCLGNQRCVRGRPRETAHRHCSSCRLNIIGHNARVSCQDARNAERITSPSRLPLQRSKRQRSRNRLGNVRHLPPPIMVDGDLVSSAFVRPRAMEPKSSATNGTSQGRDKQPCEPGASRRDVHILAASASGATIRGVARRKMRGVVL